MAQGTLELGVEMVGHADLPFILNPLEFFPARRSRGQSPAEA